jgi:hypothetical protein
VWAITAAVMLVVGGVALATAVPGGDDNDWDHRLLLP